MVAELDKRLRKDLETKGDFARVHPLPASGQDVADDLEARLVVLGPQFPYSKEADSPAEAAAGKILALRGNTPRLFQNTLMFLAVDQTRLQDLDEGLRRYLAWASVISQQAENLAPNQLRQAQAQLASASATVAARLPETYQWLLVPVQDKPTSPMKMEAFRLTGQEALAVRAARKLRGDELLIPGMAGTRLRMELDRVPLWRGDHVSIRQLVEDFARYHYLPRLTRPAVLVEAVRQGLGLLLWNQESFAYADSYDEGAGRYRGLRAGQHVSLTEDDLSGLVVKPETALAQLDRERVPALVPSTIAEPGPAAESAPGVALPSGSPQVSAPKRYHGSVTLDAARAGRDAGRIADEVLAHLVGLIGADVTVTLEIEATIPSGAPDHVVRTVTENSRTLKFRDSGFEQE